MRRHVLVVRRSAGSESESDARGAGVGDREGQADREGAGLSADSGGHHRRARAFPRVRHPARARSVGPAEGVLRRDDPRPLLSQAVLRPGPIREVVRRCRRAQRLVPLRARLQGTDDLQRLRNGEVERRHELSDPVRTRLLRLLGAAVLGRAELLRSVAHRAVGQRGHGCGRGGGRHRARRRRGGDGAPPAAEQREGVGNGCIRRHDAPSVCSRAGDGVRFLRVRRRHTLAARRHRAAAPSSTAFACAQAARVDRHTAHHLPLAAEARLLPRRHSVRRGDRLHLPHRVLCRAVLLPAAHPVLPRRVQRPVRHQHEIDRWLRVAGAARRRHLLLQRRFGRRDARLRRTSVRQRAKARAVQFRRLCELARDVPAACDRHARVQPRRRAVPDAAWVAHPVDRAAADLVSIRQADALLLLLYHARRRRRSVRTQRSEPVNAQINETHPLQLDEPRVSVKQPATRTDVQGTLDARARETRAMRRFIGDFGATAALYLESCIHCGMCADACHYYVTTENPKYTPILKVEPFKQAYKREYGPFAFFFRSLGLKPRVSAEELARWQELIYDSCTLCGRCSLICPMGIDISGLVAIARQGMAAAGLLPHELWALTERQESDGSALGVTAQGLREWLPGLAQQAGVALARVLNHVGADWTIASDGFEAGNIGTVSGRIDLQRAIVERIAQAAERRGAKTVLLPECGHAYGAMRWQASELMGRRLPFQVLHIVEYLAEATKSGTLRLKPLATTVTFHDPCQVVRRGGVGEAPRELIKALGAELVEMSPNRDTQWCCGGGGGVIAIRRADRLRHRVFQLKINQIDETGADLPVTTCSNCRQAFDDGQAYYRWDKTMHSLLEIVAGQLIEERS